MQKIELNNQLLGASFSGNLLLVQKLIKQGADINSVDNYGDTLLMEAAWESHLQVVKYLIKKGARLGTNKLHFPASIKNNKIKNCLDKIN